MQPDSIPRRGLTFAAATLSILLAFGASALPVPLMGLWTAEFGLDTAEVGMTVIAYVVGCFLTLLTLARLSEAVGRRMAVMISAALGCAATLCFLFADSAVLLMIGRLLQGFACGLVSTAAMSWAVDSAPDRAPWLGTAVSAAGPLTGFIIATVAGGALLSGGLAGPVGIFAGLLVIQVLSAALVLAASETLPARGFGGFLRPGFIPPAGSGRKLLLAGVGLVSTNALTCFFQGFSARVALELWGADAPVAMLASVVYLALIVPNAAAGFAVSKFNPLRFYLPLGILYAVTGSLAFLAIAETCAAGFLISVMICGIAQGGLNAFSLKILLAGSRIEERARLLAAVYLVSYLGTGIPNLVIMSFGRDADFTMIALGFAGWFAMTLIAICFSLARVRREATAHGEALRTCPSA
ncbi:MFS transporter [Sutterella sp.]|uniref:MFS transporter n=1 Tax=Sutterella sp. TaxID=1981025 RepID=UPI0026E007A6|nr:MFS transporter [Sutterella sp.]MDO5530824.1 MFS transporter [Sutterella sp.]